VLNASEADNASPAGRFDRWLAPLFLRFPGALLWLIDTTRYRLQPWGGEARAQRLEKPSLVCSGANWVWCAAASGSWAAQCPPPRQRPVKTERIPEPRPSSRLNLPMKSGLPYATKPARSFRWTGVSWAFRGALWSRPRSVTLIAEDDPAAGNAPCQMLLIKRKALHELFKSPQGEKFLREQLRKFVALTLPELLANNRFFHEMLYVEDVQDWDRLFAYLRGQRTDDSPGDALRQKMKALFDDDSKNWLDLTAPAAPNNADRERAIAALNKVLADPLLLPSDPSLSLFPESVRGEAGKLLEQRHALTGSETCRLNRLLMESALAPALKASSRPWPLFPEEFQKFAIDLLDVHERLGLPTPQPEPTKKTR